MERRQTGFPQCPVHGLRQTTVPAQSFQTDRPAIAVRIQEEAETPVMERLPTAYLRSRTADGLMILAMVSLIGLAGFWYLGFRFPRFPQPVLRAGWGADILHALHNGVLLDIPLGYLLAGIREFLDPVYLGWMKNQPIVAQIAVLLIFGDLVKWLMHWSHHKIPLLWRIHRLHHCTRQMDALSYARTHAIEAFSNRVIHSLTFVMILGIDLRVIAAYSAIDLLQGLWAHSNTHWATPRLNYFFATQEFHHWHHALDKEAVDKNFGGFLSIWDWVFGTAYCPRGKSVIRFGIKEMRDPPSKYWQHWLLFLKR